MHAAPPPVKRPSPRLYFANFVGHREHLVVFLEAVALRRWGESLDGPKDGATGTSDAGVEDSAEAADRQAVWNTLLELYLTLASAAGEGARGDALREKALQLLRAAERLPYDPMHALILCATRSFTPGLVLLWERLGMHEDVLRFWMEQDRRGDDPSAGAEVMRCLAQYGGEAPQLYKLALRFFTSSPELVARHTRDLAEVLRVIEERAIMPPLVVVQVLSRNEVASVGLVKDWLLARIRTAREEVHTVRFFLGRCSRLILILVYVHKDEQLTASYRLETATKLRQVEELSDPDHPRLFHATQCSQCGGHLDLPSVHFMCNHSFHQRSVPLSTFPDCLSLLTVVFVRLVDAWAIMIQSAHFVCARTASYRKYAATTSGWPTSTSFSWQTSRRTDSVLLRQHLAEAFSTGPE